MTIRFVIRMCVVIGVLILAGSMLSGLSDAFTHARVARSQP